jgi:3-deoxy-D-arabino-heptulosonate 7-phosphate (DAHP) synthase
VNCDGSGVITRVLTASNGTTADQMDNFIITGAIVEGNQLIATTIVDVQQAPSAIVAGGIFLTRTWTLLPDNQ